jgi:hypothetical protein
LQIDHARCRDAPFLELVLPAPFFGPWCGGGSSASALPAGSIASVGRDEQRDERDEAGHTVTPLFGRPDRHVVRLVRIGRQVVEAPAPSCCGGTPFQVASFRYGKSCASTVRAISACARSNLIRMPQTFGKK